MQIERRATAIVLRYTKIEIPKEVSFRFSMHCGTTYLGTITIILNSQPIMAKPIHEFPICKSKYLELVTYI